MKRISLFLFPLFCLLTLSCGSGEKAGTSDFVAFTQIGSEVVYQMDLEERDVQIKANTDTASKKWENQIRILNNTCGGFSSDRFAPVSLISPDGALLGLIDESWNPNWSPDGEYVAVACGRDDNNNVIVVSDSEHQGSSEGWSRVSRGELSDRMNIYVIKHDGSEIRELTFNNYGEWLPRWFPKAGLLPENVFAKQMSFPGFESLLLIESNKDGNSDIYVISTISTASWRLTQSGSNEQSPAWSRDGNYAIFSSDETGSFNLSFNADPLNQEMNSTDQVGRPVTWK